MAGEGTNKGYPPLSLLQSTQLQIEYSIIEQNALLQILLLGKATLQSL